MKRYDVIIIGAGHAGTEAALASARAGCASLLAVMKKSLVCHMPCNPSIGGVGKGQLVKELDAIGGEMAKAADYAGIHFKILNKSHGPAVWSSRAQVDRHKYSAYMLDRILSQKNLELIEDEACDIITEGPDVSAVRFRQSGIIKTKAVVLTPGTFLNGIIHIGLEHEQGGCYKEPASIELSLCLKRLGLTTGSLKTGTTARLKKDSIDFEGLIPQPGDKEPMPFSFSTKRALKNTVTCHITHTNSRTHDIIRHNLDRSPLYTGIIKSQGVRYCPSIEDKIVKFPQRDSHHVFLEPEGLDTDWYYPNGLSTSLPLDVQEDMIHSIKGLEKAQIIVPGYGIEYEFVQPTELLPSFESKKIGRLFLAGQINGTTGYEEAASQGLIAGINAVLSVRKRKPFVPQRAESYIGVMIDDLVTKGVDEPYRMFTSRAECRLIIREDNADIRLRKYGFAAGLVDKSQVDEAEENDALVKKAVQYLNKKKVFPDRPINEFLNSIGTSTLKKAVSAAELLRRPQISYAHIKKMGLAPEGLCPGCERIAETIVKYEGFIKRQQAAVEKMKGIEKIKMPQGIDFAKMPGLSTEIAQKLQKIRPVSLGQASRISGVTPSAVMILMANLKK